MGTLPDPLPRRPAPRPLPPRPKRDYAAEEEAARRLTSASILLRRGLLAEADAAVRAILVDSPQDAAATELLGDIQAARGDLPAAAAAYSAAMKLEPGRVSAEAKFGKATLRQAEQKRQETLGVAYAATDTAMVRRAGGERGGWAVILGSALCPGLGQIVSGQYAKGGTLIGIMIAGLGLLALLPHGGRGTYFGPLFWLVTVILAGDWIYAVADAARTASRTDEIS